MDPRISIVVLNYQGASSLAATLDSVFSQDLGSFEVIVADNASTDGSDRIATSRYSGARLLAIGYNAGCEGRNCGVAASTGDVVVTLDNDVVLTAPTDLRCVVDLFDANPLLGCLNFKILDGAGRLSSADWCHPRDATFCDTEFPTDCILEGACAFRRRAFLQVGGYWAPLFLGHEGPDLALRLINAGYEIRYSPQVRVRHLSRGSSKASPRIYRTWVRNGIWIALRQHRLYPGVQSAGKDLALMAFASMRARQSRAYLRGLGEALVGAPRALRTRRPLSPRTYARLAEVRALAPGSWAKLKRHWRERLI